MIVASFTQFDNTVKNIRDLSGNILLYVHRELHGFVHGNVDSSGLLDASEADHINLITKQFHLSIPLSYGLSDARSRIPGAHP